MQIIPRSRSPWGEKHPFFVGERTAPQQRHRGHIADFEFPLEDAYDSLAADACRPGGVPQVIHLHRAVVLNSAGFFLEVAEALQRQCGQVRLLLLEHGLDLALGATVDTRRRPPLLPVHEERVLRVDRLEAFALQCRGLRMLDRIFDATLSFGRYGRAGTTAIPKCPAISSYERCSSGS